jgi:hypothetical protein
MEFMNKVSQLLDQLSIDESQLTSISVLISLAVNLGLILK